MTIYGHNFWEVCIIERNTGMLLGESLNYQDSALLVTATSVQKTTTAARTTRTTTTARGVKTQQNLCFSTWWIKWLES